MGGWSYYRLCENLCWPFGPAPGGNLGPFWAQKMGFLKIFIRILRFIWDLGPVSSDSRRDVVSGKNLFFGKIVCFPGVNWAQKSTKTENFGYVLRLSISEIFKKGYMAVRYFWELAVVQVSCKSNVIYRSYGQETLEIGPNWACNPKK